MLVILLDALGLEFLERYRDHPVIRRLEVRELRSQFPSTTTAHVTTSHFGLPVEDHGLYEWNVLEPTLRRIICPLRFAPAEGAFYLYVDVSSLTGDSQDFCRRMLQEIGVAATPGRDFDPIHGDNWLRFSFAGSTEDIREAAHRLSRWLAAED